MTALVVTIPSITVEITDYLKSVTTSRFVEKRGQLEMSFDIE